MEATQDLEMRKQKWWSFTRVCPCLAQL